jgi:hypothetical protein
MTKKKRKQNKTNQIKTKQLITARYAVSREPKMRDVKVTDRFCEVVATATLRSARFCAQINLHLVLFCVSPRALTYSLMNLLRVDRQ